MKRYFNIIFILSMTVALTSCEKYLDVKPKGVVIPEKMSEFELILNSPTLTESFPEQLFYMTDEVFAPFNKLEDNTSSNAYFWKSQLNNDVEASPVVWGSLYRSIYNTNVIIYKVMKAVDANEVKAKQIMGEALVMRAAFYFDLATVYSKAYNKATAATDAGIPLVTSTDVTEKTPARSSMQATFDTIVNDLKTAAEYLPAITNSRARINRYVAYGMLSRVCLYMQDYANAQLYATEALRAPHALNDYNDYFTGYDLPMSEENPEVLWHRLPVDIAAIYYLVYSNDLISSFSMDDLRMQLFAMDYYGIGEYYWAGPDFGTFGINFPEIYLTKAEALVYNDKWTDAMDIVNLIRSKRISSFAYEPLTAIDKEDALKKVLEECKWELALKGTRWMDMKRLDHLKKMPAVKRVDNASFEVLEILAPKSSQYTFEIPARVLMFNPLMKKNFN